MLFRTLWISASLLVSSFAFAAPTPPSSVAAASSSSKTCADLPGRVFKNCVDGSFPGLHALEVSKDFTTFLDITDGTAGNLINWSIVASHEPGHNKVIDVQFKVGTHFYGLFNVIPKTGTEDLSAYAQGALEFDVRILDRGVYNTPLLVKLECIYPCQSGEYTLNVPTLNQWTKVSLPIADMVRDGLDLTKINIPFQIFPAWGVQDGAHFQVDNIRWVKRATKSSSSQASSNGGAISSSSSKPSSVKSSKAASSAKSSVVASVKSSSSKSSKASSLVSSMKSSKASSAKSSKTSSVKSSASSVKSAASSSAQSSATPLTCTYQEGGVYFDTTCAPWQFISAYEQNSDATIHQEILDGNGAIVSFAEVDSADGNHQKVIDVLYKNNPEYNGIVRFHGPADAANGVDMSAYATGKLIFDIKVIANSNDAADLEMVLDCGWPCQNTERLIRVPALNQWTTVELSVADLVRDGLTINKVLTGFQISPTWGHQIGAHFQLDNIRWVKGTTPIATQVCWAQNFNTPTWTYGLRVDQFFGVSDVTNLIRQVAPVSILEPVWSEPFYKWGYAVTADGNFNLCSTSGTLSASVYIPASYVNDGRLRVGIYGIDDGGRVAFYRYTSAAELKGDDWNTITAPLAFYNPSSPIPPPYVEFDATFNGNVTMIGISFDANGKDPSVGGTLKVDNIVITQPTK